MGDRLPLNEPYVGSRRRRYRFRYGEESRAGFVELLPSFYPRREQAPQEFKELLERVTGVERVELKATRASQGDLGQHYCDANLLVYSSFAGPNSASPPIVFVLTRHQHMQNSMVEPTLTAMFRDPPKGLLREAWRILLDATDGFQLLPMHVREYMKSHVARWETRQVLTAPQSSPAFGDAPVPDSAQSLPAPAQPVAASSSADGPSANDDDPDCFDWELIHAQPQE